MQFRLTRKELLLGLIPGAVITWSIFRGDHSKRFSEHWRLAFRDLEIFDPYLFLLNEDVRRFGYEVLATQPESVLHAAEELGKHGDLRRALLQDGMSGDTSIVEDWRVQSTLAGVAGALYLRAAEF